MARRLMQSISHYHLLDVMLASPIEPMGKEVQDGYMTKLRAYTVLLEKDTTDLDAAMSVLFMLTLVGKLYNEGMLGGLDQATMVGIALLRHSLFDQLQRNALLPLDLEDKKFLRTALDVMKVAISVLPEQTMKGAHRSIAKQLRKSLK